MKKFFKLIMKFFYFVKNLLTGKGLSSIDLAKRKEQIQERDEQDEKIKEVLEDEEIDKINDMLGWDDKSDRV